MKQDLQLFELIRKEKERQAGGLELIASENYVSDQVLEAMGSICTNKYAEGYPGKRYYGGCEIVDQIEQLAIDRLKTIYGAEYANVQPHSGAQANMAVYFALLKPGDTVILTILAQTSVDMQGAECFVDKRRKSAQHAQGGIEHAGEADGPSLCLGESGDEVAGADGLGVLRPEGAAVAVFDEQTQKFAQIINKDHAALVVHERKDGQRAGAFDQQGKIALAAWPVDHWRAHDGGGEIGRGESPDAGFGFEL